MKNILKAISGVVLFTTLFSCSRIDEPQAVNHNQIESIPYIIATLGDDDTRTDFSYSTETYRLKSTWAVGDKIAITPVNDVNYNDLCLIFNSGIYEVTDAGGNTATFKCNTSVSATGSYYFVCYPGDKVKSTSSFRNFTYSGQVQKKSAPTAHMGKYFSMRQIVEDYSTVNFSGADKSSCMRFKLSGMTFNSPQSIQLKLIGNSATFYENNYISENYTYYTPNDAPNDDIPVKTLTLDLEGYGNETDIEAFLMMSCSDLVLDKGSILRVMVKDGEGNRWYSDTKINSATTLHGGYCHTLTIKDGWSLSTADYTEYDWDGEVVTIQEKGTKLDLIIMGDGFIKEDFDNGTYESIMLQAYNEFFSIEPFKTLKDGFNVYYIKTPSPERNQAIVGTNGGKNTGHETKFSTQIEENSTYIGGDNNLVVEYALKALKTNANERINNATIVVMANIPGRSGTCHMFWSSNTTSDYGQGISIAYCALGHDDAERIQLMHHEICGHGFGKLGDEYYYTITSFSGNYWTTLESQHAIGVFRNTDKWISSKFNTTFGTSLTVTQPEDVIWNDLMYTANKYEESSTESLGFYEGGNTMNWGFCRPTEKSSKSIMNGNKGIFNAISRRQIYYRYRHLTGELTTNCFGDSLELNAFLAWDKANIMDKIYPGTKTVGEDAVLMNVEPIAPPVLVKGKWVDGKFVKE